MNRTIKDATVKQYHYESGISPISSPPTTSLGD
jgi:hypothetical protein